MHNLFFFCVPGESEAEFVRRRQGTMTRDAALLRSAGSRKGHLHDVHVLLFSLPFLSPSHICRSSHSIFHERVKHRWIYEEPFPRRECARNGCVIHPLGMPATKANCEKVLQFFFFFYIGLLGFITPSLRGNGIRRWTHSLSYQNYKKVKRCATPGISLG